MSDIVVGSSLSWTTSAVTRLVAPSYKMRNINLATLPCWPPAFSDCAGQAFFMRRAACGRGPLRRLLQQKAQAAPKAGAKVAVAVPCRVQKDLELPPP